MGFYRDHVVPRLVNWTCSGRGMDRWRARACEGLAGSVVEIGFGSGTNVKHYPPTVQHVYAVEPSSLARKLARPKIGESTIEITYAGLDGHAIDLANESCDGALCTFTLCTLDDPQRALQELWRILKPGATLHFLEHGISPDAPVAKWQHRLDGLEQRLADGCHLTRDPVGLMTQAGFEMKSCQQRYVRGPKPWCYFSAGVCVKPAP
jgi:SAM-dependent methyltransferase